MIQEIAQRLRQLIDAQEYPYKGLEGITQELREYLDGDQIVSIDDIFPEPTDAYALYTISYEFVVLCSDAALLQLLEPRWTDVHEFQEHVIDYKISICAHLSEPHKAIQVSKLLDEAISFGKAWAVKEMQCFDICLSNEQSEDLLKNALQQNTRLRNIYFALRYANRDLSTAEISALYKKYADVIDDADVDRAELLYCICHSDMEKSEKSQIANRIVQVIMRSGRGVSNLMEMDRMLHRVQLSGTSIDFLYAHLYGFITGNGQVNESLIANFERFIDRKPDDLTIVDMIDRKIDEAVWLRDRCRTSRQAGYLINEAERMAAHLQSPFIQNSQKVRIATMRSCFIR